MLGHPVALLPLLLSKTGAFTNENLTLGDGSSGGSSSTRARASGFIRSWTNWAKGCFTNPNQCPMSPLFPVALLGTLYQIKAVVDQIIRGVKLVKMAMQFVQIARNLRRIANAIIQQGGLAGGGVRIDRLLCPNKIKIFYPYYLSGVDALFWRSGWPITDAQHTATLLNPLSTDRIGGLGEVWGSISSPPRLSQSGPSGPGGAGDQRPGRASGGGSGCPLASEAYHPGCRRPLAGGLAGPHGVLPGQHRRPAHAGRCRRRLRLQHLGAL